MQKNGVHNILRFGLMVSIFVLAVSIFYFSNTLLKVNKNIPDIVNQVTIINKNIDTITTKSIPDILKAIPEITTQIDNVQSKIPLIIAETQAIRESTVPNIISEAESIEQQIPSILKRIDSINAQVPSITTSISEVTLTANQAMLRVDSINKQIPEILTTIKVTNDSISSYMLDAKILVNEAGEISKNAGKNVGSGILGGILSTPFNVTKSIGSFVFGKKEDIKDEEAKELESQALSFLNKNSDESGTLWSSAKINASGKIKVLKTFTKKGRQIKKILITFKKPDDNEKSAKVHFFRKEDGTWSFWK